MPTSQRSAHSLARLGDSVLANCSQRLIWSDDIHGGLSGYRFREGVRSDWIMPKANICALSPRMAKTCSPSADTATLNPLTASDGEGSWRAESNCASKTGSPVSLPTPRRLPLSTMNTTTSWVAARLPTTTPSLAHSLLPVWRSSAVSVHVVRPVQTRSVSPACTGAAAMRPSSATPQAGDVDPLRTAQMSYGAAHSEILSSSTRK